MTDTEEMMNPTLMIRRAVLPTAMVWALEENSPIRLPGTAQHSTVPSTMIPADRASPVQKICRTRPFSFAP